VKKFNLADMIRGWFVGNFSPTAYLTPDVEVAVKQHKANDEEDAHLHKIATEINVVLSGDVEFNGELLQAGDIVVIEQYESVKFRSKTDSVLVVVKIPGASNDKYLI
jgi:hypothetical protein